MTLQTKFRFLAALLVSLFIVAKHSICAAMVILLAISIWAYVLLWTINSR